MGDGLHDTPSPSEVVLKPNQFRVMKCNICGLMVLGKDGDQLTRETFAHLAANHENGYVNISYFTIELEKDGTGRVIVPLTEQAQALRDTWRDFDGPDQGNGDPSEHPGRSD